MSAPIQNLNILIYAGPGASPSCISQATSTLTTLLTPSYAVAPISSSALLKEPWQRSCALLVFPGGADSLYCDTLNGPAGGTRRISEYVRRGGKYLGLCAGGYFGSRRCEFEVGDGVMRVIGGRELGFFPGTCRGGAFKGFKYRSEAGTRAASLGVRKGAFGEGVQLPDTVVSYCNGGGVYVDAEGMRGDGVEVLATFEDDIDVDGGGGKAAAVHCKVGDGAAVLMGPHPEFSPSLLPKQLDIPGYDDILKTLEGSKEDTLTFLGACLSKLGLEVNADTPIIPPMSELYLSALDDGAVAELIHSLQDITEKDHETGFEVIKAENDTFRLLQAIPTFSVSAMQNALPTLDSKPDEDPLETQNPAPKNVFFHEQSHPSPAMTPNFNHDLYYQNLSTYRARESRATEWGSPLFFAKVLTSTNTILDKNPRLLSRLPTGFTAVATTQTSGRGRGNNVWVSPPGQMILSVVINHPAHLAVKRPVVFVNYLAAIAVAEGVKGYEAGGYGGVGVRLKWPNDVYARNPQFRNPGASFSTLGVGSALARGSGAGSGAAARNATAGGNGDPEFIKIGGILASCSYNQGSYNIVLGIGLNTTNPKPTTSLNALLPPGTEPFGIEKLTARILTRLEALWARFLEVGFSRDLEERYYAHWLHSGQEVSVEADVVSSYAYGGGGGGGGGGYGGYGGAATGMMKARVEGITTDFGMLKVRELDPEGRATGKAWALQSDENSFDFWRGLVRRKI